MAQKPRQYWLGEGLTKIAKLISPVHLCTQCACRAQFETTLGVTLGCGS